MKSDDIKSMFLITGAIMHAERQIVEATKPYKEGCGDMPSVGRSYDQSGSTEIKGIADARAALAERITQAFKLYRSDLVALLGPYERKKR